MRAAPGRLRPDRGLALALYGSSQLTFDVDLVPAAERANLDRPAAALGELRTKVVVYADPSEIHLSESIWTAQAMLDNPFPHLRVHAGDVVPTGPLADLSGREQAQLVMAIRERLIQPGRRCDGDDPSEVEHSLVVAQ